MRRREFITLLGGAAAWPLAARAQQGERMRRIGVLLPAASNDAEFQARMEAFQQGLQQAGWSIGRNVQLDIRWATPDAAKIRQQATELVALAPDVILTTGGSTMVAMQQATRTLPVVFVQVPDPVGAGFVDSLARPGGNATGFTQFEYGVGAKLLELLKEISPGLMRAVVLRDPTSPDGVGQFAAIQAVGLSLGVELRAVGVRDPDEIDRAVTTIARGPGGGLIVTASGLAILHRERIIALAARHRLVAVYPYRFFVINGGLISYGPSSIDPYRRAAGYVDRILKGEKPADLPVQAPTKYELVINLRTTKTLGCEVPASVLARADEVIE
ncbi:MAG TPA: ABC transporter substrate-binding protein [Xanthobacteraceae bacterium]|nr:ABC transporter substrate-binding protein [Xanthobacteraceae bacterium]